MHSKHTIPVRAAAWVAAVLPIPLLAASCAGGGDALAPAPRNVLFVMIDDLRPSLGCYGDPVARTPHIDAIAREGVLFGRAYCQQAVCSPSRESLLTGCRPDTTGVRDLSTSFRKKLPDAVSLPQLFKDAGWQARAFGKVHHGGGRLDDLPSWSAPPWWPAVQHYHTERGEEVLREVQEAYDGQFGDFELHGLALEAPEVDDDVLIDGLIASEVIRALEETAGEPFFFAVGFKKPHLPYVAPKRYWDLYPPDAMPLAERRTAPDGAPACAITDGPELRSYYEVPNEGPLDEALQRELKRGYYACVSHVDSLVGDLIATLKRLDLWDETIVVIWGDHGYQLGELGMWTKHTNFEAATRAPLIVRVPGSPNAGARSDRLVEFVDVYPTLAELCGLTPPDRLEGLSLTPLIRDPGRPWKQAAFSQFARPVPGTRRKAMGRSIRTESARLTAWRLDGEVIAKELYDYAADPLGARNLAADPAYDELARDLFTQLNAGWMGALPQSGGE